MNEKVRQLKDLDDDIKGVIVRNQEALRREVGVDARLTEVSKEVTRRFERVSEVVAYKQKESDPAADIQEGINKIIAGVKAVVSDVFKK